MKALTQNEFMQGVAFTHKGTNQLYSSLKYLNSSLYCFLFDLGTQTKQLDYIVKNITKNSFDIQTIFFDSMETKTVLFADCFVVENQPLTTN